MRKNAVLGSYVRNDPDAVQPRNSRMMGRQIYLVGLSSGVKRPKREADFFILESRSVVRWRFTSTLSHKVTN
jgi:hypothetical protein